MPGCCPAAPPSGLSSRPAWGSHTWPSQPLTSSTGAPPAATKYCDHWAEGSFRGCLGSPPRGSKQWPTVSRKEPGSLAGLHAAGDCGGSRVRRGPWLPDSNQGCRLHPAHLLPGRPMPGHLTQLSARPQAPHQPGHCRGEIRDPWVRRAGETAPGPHPSRPRPPASQMLLP